MWDATGAAVSLRAPEAGRRAAILITHGRVGGNRLGVADVARRASAAGIMREMYTLRFTSPHTDGQMHTIDVRVKHPGASVRTRSAYQAPATP